MMNFVKGLMVGCITSASAIIVYKEMTNKESFEEFWDNYLYD